jgi:hypothetical protein
LIQARFDGVEVLLAGYGGWKFGKTNSKSKARGHFQGDSGKVIAFCFRGGILNRAVGCSSSNEDEVGINPFESKDGESSVKG